MLESQTSDVYEIKSENSFGLLQLLGIQITTLSTEDCHFFNIAK
ncbi:unnamed protein product [Larinioides sclopetarius]|uniref:Uncharacterized protein n=1 Tax=Larinioides sclopetarius TaxID=280406 RepID=A0AAV1ZI54_9ARAC